MHIKNIIATPHNNGFSLIELSIVISVAATLAIGVLSWIQPANKTNALKSLNTRNEMVEIIRALQAFRTSKGRLPCPADPYMRADNTRASDAPADTYVNNFGMEDLDTNQSDSSLGINCPSNTGMVPVRSLGIESSYAEDAWGRRYTYHVSNALCTTDNSPSIGCTRNDYDKATAGNIIVRTNASVTDGSADLTTQAAFSLISYGADGSGAFLPGGKQLPTTGASTDELENTDNDSIFVRTDFSSTFDDIVLFKTKSQFENLTTDQISTVVDIPLCNQNATTLNEVTATEATALNTLIPSLDAQTSSQGVLNLLWSTQNICTRYFGQAVDANTGWNGPKCPGGGKYFFNPTSLASYCICSNGQWDSTCED